MSQQNALNKVFQAQDDLGQLPTASAYCQARQKLQPELFAALNQQTTSDFYRLSATDGSLVRWHGHRMVGVDGTTLNLPDTPELRRAFSVVANQHTTYLQGSAVVLYDLGNDFGLAAHLGPLSGEKGPLFENLWSQTQAGDVLVLDRNFADYELIVRATQAGRHVVIRCSRHFKAVKQFWQSDTHDQVVTLEVPQTNELRKLVKQQKLPASLQVRLLKFTLPDGQCEVLLTDLSDPHTYPAIEFYQLYGRRWGQETYYDRFKHIFEVERWSGLSLLTIHQDFQGVLFLTTLESVLAQSAQAALNDRDQQRQPKTQAQVNRAVSYVALVDQLVQLLLDTRIEPADTLARLHLFFQSNPTRRRPNRHFKRPPLKHSRRLRFLLYQKRLSS